MFSKIIIAQQAGDCHHHQW